MGYRTKLALAKDSRKGEILSLLDQLEEHDCTAHWLPAANEVEIKVPDDGYTWIVTGGLSRLLGCHSRVVESEPVFTDALPPSFYARGDPEEAAGSAGDDGDTVRDCDRHGPLETAVKKRGE